MSVIKITATEARNLHVNYLLNLGGGSGMLTQAVIFDFNELSDAIQQAFGHKESFNKLLNPDFGFVVYYGRYPVDMPDKGNRNTLIVQFVKRISGNWHAIEDEIYNFGDLKPPKIIYNEQVTP